MKKSTPKRIKSFVRRQGRMSASQKKAIKDYWPMFGLELRSFPYDFDQVFDREAERIVEIGFGTGDSLLEMATTHPEKDFIGIEVHRPGIGRVLLNCAKLQVNNIRLFAADAIDVFSQCIAEDSIDGVNIFFPDPWPKTRHHKRRLLQAEFVELIYPSLKIGATVHLATDWQNYAEEMLDIFSQEPTFINAAGNLRFCKNRGQRPKTKFEQRGENLGHPIWDLIFIKRG